MGLSKTFSLASDAGEIVHLAIQIRYINWVSTCYLSPQIFGNLDKLDIIFATVSPKNQDTKYNNKKNKICSINMYG